MNISQHLRITDDNTIVPELAAFKAFPDLTSVPGYTAVGRLPTPVSIVFFLGNGTVFPVH